ncbi:MAG TPA: tail fiber domain-containing protein [Sedimentisphaerales bacterium]|nr:tail fiber domain-containing protein [Sedimentisphaerales bacterium]HNU30353.1 tail fiber domain-containing protein [Sedimentisphaerales bacterium]
MRTTGYAAIMVLVLSLAGQLLGQGQVKFRGMVTTDEASDVPVVCYGDYTVAVAIDLVLDDPNDLLAGLQSVQVCYKTACHLLTGDYVEVNGCYWAENCPKQYCRRVQILHETDYVMLVTEGQDADWMVLGDDLYSIPTGNVGIGTDNPQEKLHVAGNVLVEGTSPWLRFAGALGSDAGISLTAASVGVNLWEIRRDGPSAGLVVAESFPYPPFGGDRVTVEARTGYVGLGVADPDYRLTLPDTGDASGQAVANAWKTYSSERWKTGIQTLDNAMAKVRQLRGVAFDWKSSGTHDIGLIAEEVGKVIPEIVDYEANGTDARSLAYDKLVALLIEALKEQDARIAELEQIAAEQDRLNQRLETLERLVQQPSVTQTEVQTQR